MDHPTLARLGRRVEFLMQRDQRDAEIYRLHDQMLSEREIAKKLGCSRTTVWTTLQRRKVVA